MGTLEQKWGPNGDPKTEKGPHGDLGIHMGTHVGAVHYSPPPPLPLHWIIISIVLIYWLQFWPIAGLPFNLNFKFKCQIGWLQFWLVSIAGLPLNADTVIPSSPPTDILPPYLLPRIGSGV